MARSNTTTLQSAAVSSNLTFKLPSGYGTSGDCIVGDGAGGFSFSSTCGAGGSGTAPVGASYLTLGLDGTLTSERVLTAGSNISITDGGANGNLTVNVVNNPTFSTSVTTPSVTNSGALSINATSANLTLQTTTSGNVVINGAGILDVQDDASFTGTLGVTGTTTLTGALTVNNTAYVRNLTTGTATATDDQLILSVTTGGAGRFTGTITSTDLTANRSYTLPNAGGTFAVSASTPLTLNTTTGNLTIADAAANGTTKGAASFTANDFNDSAGNISLDYANGQAASGSAKGFLTSADWTTFNGKLSAEADTLQSVIARGATATSAATFNGGASIRGLTVDNATAADDRILITSAALGSGSRFDGTITNANLTAARTYTLQDNSGIVPLGTAGNTLFFTTSGATSLTLPTTGTVCTTATCLTSFSEADTLQSVTTRGATTTTASSFTGGATIRNLTVDTATATDDLLVLSVTTGGAGRFTGTITSTDLTANRSYTLPNAGGTFAVSASTPLTLNTTTGNLTIADAAANGTTKGAASFTANDFNDSAGNISLDYANGQAASGSAKGFLTSADWTTFNGKLSAEADTLQSVIARGATATSAATFNGGASIRGLTVDNATAADDRILITSAALGSGSRFDGTITNANLTAARTYTLQDNSGIVPLGTAGNTLFFTTSGATSLTLPTTGTVCTTATCLTSFSEADTLQSVTTRGATTTTASSFTGGATIRNLTVDTATATDDLLVLSVTTGGAGRFTGTITSTDLTANRSYTLPNAGGTFAVSASTPLTLNTTTGNLTIADAAANGTTKGAASFTANDFNDSAGNISLDYANGQAASGSAKGFLTSADWTTFNGKLSAEADTLQSVIARGATATSAATFNGGASIRGLTVDNATAADDRILITSAALGSGSRFDGTITNANLTAARTYTLQDNSGIVPLGTAGNTLFFTTSGATSLTLPTTGTVCTTATCLTSFSEADTLASVTGRGATTATASSFTGGASIRGLTVDNATAADDRILITSAALGSGSRFDGTITNANLTAARTYTLQDNSGIVPLGTAGNTLFFTTSGATSLTLPTTGTVCTTATCLTSFSEADTLASVTGRGATTATASSFTGGATIRNLTVDTATATDDLLVLSVTTGGAGRFTGTITSTDLTANRSYTLPNAGGTFAVSASTPLTLNTTTGNLTIADAAANGTTKGAASFTANDFNDSAGNISLDYANGQAASGSAKGFLTSADWTTFNGKLSAEADTLQSVIARGATATSAATFNGGASIRGLTVDNATAADDRILITSAALGSGSRFDGTITNANLTAARTYTLQDNSGIVPLGTAGNTLFFTTSGATSLTLPTTGTVCTTATCLTSFSEADTLASVTGRGATTATASSFTGGATIRNLTVDTATATDDLLVLSVTTGGAGRFTGTITSTDLTANRSYTLPNAGGTFAVSASTPLTLNTTTGNLTIADAAANGTTKGAASFTANDFNDSAGNISLDYANGQAASGSAKGFLTSADWTTFNGKLSAEADTLQSVHCPGCHRHQCCYL